VNDASRIQVGAKKTDGAVDGHQRHGVHVPDDGVLFDARILSHVEEAMSSFNARKGQTRHGAMRIVTSPT